MNQIQWWQKHSYEGVVKVIAKAFQDRKEQDIYKGVRIWHVSVMMVV